MTADDPTPQPADEPPTPDAGAVEAADEQPAPPPLAEAASAADAEEVVADAPTARAEPANGAAPPAEAPAGNKKWYIIKVTSGREESIKAAIERRVKIEGLEEFFGQIHIPVERVTEIKKVKETKNGEKVTKERRVTKERKKFPGYIMAEVEFNDRILYLFRETSGVGDFVGAGGPGKPPPPMTDIEVKRMLGEAVPGDDPKKSGRKTVVKLDFEKGDKVRIREGAFSNMEGEVKEITEPKEAGETPKVTVEVQIFGRPVGVELDYWQVDKS
jgi:transcription termination/antitermination protein NusG